MCRRPSVSEPNPGPTSRTIPSLAPYRVDCQKHYEFTACDAGECRVAALPFLFEISRGLANGEKLQAILGMLLGLMQERMKIDRAAVWLQDKETGNIQIHRSFGIPEREAQRGVYFAGEGITGKVLETGETIVLPRLIEAPEYLNRTHQIFDGTEEDVSFICVPIRMGRRVLGTISAQRSYTSAILLRQDAELLATLAGIIAPAVELHLLEQENGRLRQALQSRFRPSNLIGNSKPMQEVYDLVRRVTDTQTTVLLLGESGVGKELVAGAVHSNGTRARGPLVTFNCAALPETLVESELFGHEKGAFTGAVASHLGRFEQANGGTLFLDEVGELSLAAQAKLLRVLQERVVERIGGKQAIPIDIRVIAATNRDLAAEVASGRFREDLYYRLNVFPIVVPPLRARGSDVIILADHFVARISATLGKSVKRISTPALDMLMAYHWPGNVRELENVIERAVILADDEVIHHYTLPPSLQTAQESGTAYQCGLETKVRSIELEMIVEALKTHSGNVTAAAQSLGITRRALALKMARHELDYRTFRRHKI